MQVIGKVGLNLGELTSTLEAQIEHKIPISLQIDGVSTEASLRVSKLTILSFSFKKNFPVFYYNDEYKRLEILRTKKEIKSLEFSLSIPHLSLIHI